jgi:hypothetical protein
VSDILGDLAQGVLAGIFGDLLATRRRRRLERRGEFEVAMRVLDGKEAGLTTGWSHLIGSFEPGAMLYRERRSKTVRKIQILRVDRSQQRQPQGREAFTSVNPSLRVFRLETGTGTLEVGVHHEYVSRIAQAVAR